MAIDWSLARQPNALAMMLQGFDQGQELKRQEKSRTALGAILGGGVTPQPTSGRVGGAIDPSMAPGGGIGGGIQQQRAEMGGAPAIPWNDLTPEDMRTAITVRGQQQTQQTAQAKQQQDQLVQMGRLLDGARDEGSYQQSLAAAKQIGIDVSRAPANFDANWINQQKMVLSAFEKDGGKAISGLARELQDAGYQPGTTAFQEAMGIALQGKYAPQYTDGQGNLRQGSLPRLPAPGQPAPQAPMPKIIPQRPAGVDDAELFRQAQEAVAGGANRNEVFEQLQAWGVKP